MRKHKWAPAAVHGRRTPQPGLSSWVTCSVVVHRALKALLCQGLRPLLCLGMSNRPVACAGVWQIPTVKTLHTVLSVSLSGFAPLLLILLLLLPSAWNTICTKLPMNRALPERNSPALVFAQA